MSSRDDTQFDITNHDHLANFRLSAAGIIRDILAAVQQSESRDVVPVAVYQKWSMATRSSTRPPAYLLTNAARSWDKFVSQYLSDSESIAAPDDLDEETTEKRVDTLRQHMGTFADSASLSACFKSEFSSTR